MKSTFLFLKIAAIILPLTMIAHHARSQDYYTPPGRDEPLMIGIPGEGRDYYSPIQIGTIFGDFVYSDARDTKNQPTINSKAKGAVYKFTLHYPSTIVIDQLGSEMAQNMTIHLMDWRRNEIQSDWYREMSELPQEYLDHPYTVAGSATEYGYWNAIYKENLEPGEYFIVSNGGYGNAGAYLHIMVTNLYVYSNATEGPGFDNPFFLEEIEPGFRFTDSHEMSRFNSVYGRDNPDIVYAFFAEENVTITATTKGSEYPDSQIYILNFNQDPVPGVKTVNNSDGSVTVTFNPPWPDLFFLVSESGADHGVLTTTIEAYTPPDPSEDNGPMPQPDPDKKILPEPGNNDPIRFQYDDSGNTINRIFFWRSWSR